MNIARFSIPTQTHFGPGASKLVKEAIRSAGYKRPLVVTDKGIAGLPIYKNFLTSLEDGLSISSFSEILGNPLESQVIAGVKAYKSHNADMIVGFGGGAALDVAKAIALMVNHPGNLFDYEDEKPGASPIDKEIPFWVALPTTSGTGSEVGRSSVIGDDKTHVKKIIFSPRLLAKIVFADPELTLDIPAKITAATGMDALTHCVEAFLAKGYNPICDGIALEGFRLAAENLAKSVKNPKDLDARTQMMMASMMGAIAFQKGLGLTHSIAHSLSTVADVHHGLANALVIDYALKFNIPAVPERFERLCAVIGLKERSGDSFINWLKELKKEIGIPAKLSQEGITKEQIERLCDLSVQDGCHLSNPRECTREDFKRIITEAL